MVALRPVGPVRPAFVKSSQLSHEPHATLCSFSRKVSYRLLAKKPLSLVKLGEAAEAQLSNVAWALIYESGSVFSDIIDFGFGFLIDTARRCFKKAVCEADQS